MYTYPYPRPMVAVDIVLFLEDQQDLQVLLIQRAREPFQGSFALPGGFVNQDESLEEAAARELEEETGLNKIPLEQIHTFSEPDRDPRGRVISTAFGAVLDSAAGMNIKAGSDAAGAAWYSTSHLPELVFDHRQMIHFAIDFFHL